MYFKALQFCHMFKLISFLFFVFALVGCVNPTNDFNSEEYVWEDFVFPTNISEKCEIKQ